MSNDTENLRAELLARLHEVDDLEMAGAVLGWDQATYMPPGGAAARGRQLATLGRSWPTRSSPTRRSAACSRRYSAYGRAAAARLTTTRA
jgi:Zn-dependent M32 family carboxypeptidase